MSRFSARFVDSIEKIGADCWQDLFGRDDPFTRYEYLAALEQSGCVSSETGWTVTHLLLLDGDQVIAAAPCYLKAHSFGEYIFDWSWADAYRRHGLSYYPKLVCVVPFTPVTGKRIGIAQRYQAQTDLVLHSIRQSLTGLAESSGASNLQCLFLPEPQAMQLKADGWLHRHDVQFHWFNNNYHSFDDFVAGFTSRRRKNLLKERSRIRQAGVTFEVLEGNDISPALWQRFFRYYQATYLKRSGHAGYLSQTFFDRLGQSMPESLVMVIAKKEDSIVAAALFFKSSNTLYGRYWGAEDAQSYLHFECCYYQGIEYCIVHGLDRFDAGAQGEHKLQRGFEPVINHACYRIFHPRFAAAIATYLDEEKVHIDGYAQDCREQLPYKAT